MALTITIADVKIDTLRVNYDTDPRVVVSYALKDAAGRVWYTGDAYFWTVLPASPGVEDFLLPASYITTFVDLRAAADTALTNRFGV
jgi:hypothetical protein